MGDNCDALRSVTAQDVLDGNVSVPYMQRNSWIEVQTHDPAHTKLKYLISIGQLPEPKKTCGVHTYLKQLHNLYKKDGLVEVRQHGNDKTGWVVSIPQSMFPGSTPQVITSIKISNDTGCPKILLYTWLLKFSGHPL